MSARAFVPVVLLALAASGVRAEFGTPPIKVAESLSVGQSDDKELPVKFNDGYSFVISMHQKMPKAAVLEKLILWGLAKDKQTRDKLLYEQFGTVAAPELVEVYIGDRVPLEVVRVLLTELSKTELKLVFSVMTDDEQFGNRQRVYIGGLVPSGKKAVERDKMKELLDPKLTHKELLAAINKLK